MQPRITVVTPSYNQGKFIARTIESVQSQGYANLEHIVVDGMSTDETAEVLARYPQLRVLREPDHGQSDAINKGFRLATGDIYCFLNSDDTLLPGSLARVAREIDPARGRHIVLGRCLHIDEEDNILPVEHPSFYLGHRRVLEVWKQNVIPQPAAFWSAEVWHRCGPMDQHESMVLDYDLFCRFTRDYEIHFLDHPLATYRLHPESKTCTRTDAAVLRRALDVSQRYWGPAWKPFYWGLFASLTWWRVEQVLQRKRWSSALLDRYQQARKTSNPMLALTFLAAATGCAPELVFRREVLPRVGRFLDGLLPADADLWRPERTEPATLACRGFTGQYDNGCIGPTYTTSLRVMRGHTAVELDLEGVVQPMPWPLTLDLWLDGRHVCRHHDRALSELSLRVPLQDVPPGEHDLTIVSSSYLVPHEYLGNGDYRPLSLRLKGLSMVGDPGYCRSAELRKVA